MSAPPPSPPIVHSPRQAVRDAVGSELKGLGYLTSLYPKERDACIEALITSPDSILIVDWAYGSEHVNAVLAAIKGHFLVETRPIFLLIDELIDDVVATGAEYGVSQIHAGPIERESVRACLRALLDEASMTADLRSALISVADARARKDWPLASKLLEELHAARPDEERVALELAENLIVEQSFDRALEVLIPFATQEPPNVRAMHLLGRANLSMGRADEAIELLTRAKIINPHNVDRLVDLGNAFFRTNKIDAAMENFKEASNLDSTNKMATVGQSKCLLMTGDVNEALALMKTVSGPREMASIFNTAAVLAIRVGQFEQGLSLYRSAIGALGKNELVLSRLHFNMGLGYRRWSKLDKALACFLKSLELDPNFEKAARQKKLAEAALGGAPAADLKDDAFAEEDLGGRSSQKIALPKDEELFEDD